MILKSDLIENTNIGHDEKSSFSLFLEMPIVSQLIIGLALRPQHMRNLESYLEGVDAVIPCLCCGN
jgi:hypothetical protein